MPFAHADCGKLCRTKAVVDATIDKNTPPNNMPEKTNAGNQSVKTVSYKTLAYRVSGATYSGGKFWLKRWYFSITSAVTEAS